MSELKGQSQTRIGIEDGQPLVIDAGAATDEVFSVLADEHRRQVLAVISEESTPMAVSTLAERVADRMAPAHSDSASDEAVDRLIVSLYHQHLPKIADAGLVRVDTETNTVEATEAMSS